MTGQAAHTSFLWILIWVAVMTGCPRVGWRKKEEVGKTNAEEAKAVRCRSPFSFAATETSILDIHTIGVSTVRLIRRSNGRPANDAAEERLGWKVKSQDDSPAYFATYLTL